MHSLKEKDQSKVSQTYYAKPKVVEKDKMVSLHVIYFGCVGHVFSEGMGTKMCENPIELGH